MDLFARSPDERIPSVSKKYATFQLKQRLILFGLSPPPKGILFAVFDPNEDPKFAAGVNAARTLYKLRSNLPNSVNNPIGLLLKHFNEFNFWFCSICHQNIIASQKHKCLKLSASNKCNIVFPNGQNCQFFSSQDNLKNLDHHKSHSFCFDHSCSIHKDKIWQPFPFENESIILDNSESFADFNLIHIDCSKFENDLDKRHHFLRVLTSLSNVLRARCMSVCSCTNHCHCARKLIVSDPCLIQSNISMANKTPAQIVSQFENYDFYAKGTRILGFDTFSFGKSKTQKRNKNSEKRNEICDLKFGFRNFQTAFRKLRSLEHEIKCIYPNVEQKNVFVVSTALFEQIKKNLPNQLNNFVFSKSSFICQVKTDINKLNLIIEQVPTIVKVAKNVKLSKRSLFNELSDSSEDDFVSPKVKKSNKKKKKKNEIFHQLGKKHIFSDSDGDVDEIFKKSFN